MKYGLDNNKHFYILKNRLIISDLFLSMVPSKNGIMEYLDRHPNMNNINRIFIFIPYYMDRNVFDNMVVTFKYNILQNILRRYVTEDCKLIIVCSNKFRRDELKDALKSSSIKNVKTIGGCVPFSFPNENECIYFTSNKPD